MRHGAGLSDPAASSASHMHKRMGRQRQHDLFEATRAAAEFQTIKRDLPSRAQISPVNPPLHRQPPAPRLTDVTNVVDLVGGAPAWLVDEVDHPRPPGAVRSPVPVQHQTLERRAGGGERTQQCAAGPVAGPSGLTPSLAPALVDDALVHDALVEVESRVCKLLERGGWCEGAQTLEPGLLTAREGWRDGIPPGTPPSLHQIEHVFE
ncbi:hypothetical protein GCM10025868_46900 [Angustibacter aerolatus]|uniref:DUF222 domain-containing protein n=1 Tax=Angustibacter aerolatus TaxID=1162965 RepID=A0ABQ6JRW8_9ACTN|nr:hypothetical protein GCM10025868_46900 [Angustibacter aerolatus]